MTGDADRFRPRPRKPPAEELRARREFEGVIRLITFEGEAGVFKIVTFRTDGDAEFKAAGNFLGATAGEPLLIKGEWREHLKHGWTFQVESAIPQIPSSTDAITAYLGSGLIRGIGPKTAERIVERFGEKTIQILDETPELLREVPKLNKSALHKIIEDWTSHRAMRDVMLFLKQQGLSNAIAMRLIKHYGENAAAVLKTNPYRVGLDVRHIGFVKADEIAAKMGIAKDSPERVQAAFVHLLDQASAEGHTYLPREMLLERALAMLEVDPKLIADTLAQAVANKYLKRVTVGENPECYFIPSLFTCESGCAKLIRALMDAAKSIAPAAEVDSLISEFENRFRFQLAPQQQDALRMVASGGGVNVITGGPGTGKTTLVRALIHVLKREGVRIGLCSPTGRAAQRLSETTHEEATTIHRLLKWNPQKGGFTHDREKPLELNVLIVDEASMLDIPLAFSLLRALSPGTTVVFVGDVDQLPSVGAGTFLRDLITSGCVRTTRLLTIFRQASQSLIIRNSHRINEGHFIIQPEENEESDFFFIERKEPEAIRETLITLLTKRIPNKLKCDPIDDIQVLTPMRRGALGTHELNVLIQSHLNPKGFKLGDDVRFKRGDKVIQIVNNYELNVYNGDVGKVLGIDQESQQVRVKFGQEVVRYPFENLDELESAYAITIHKSQGSEYAAVVVILHTSHYVMLKRNLIYTAITRGKKLVVVVGSKRALFQAIQNSGSAERMTALGTWLTRPTEKEELFD